MNKAPQSILPRHRMIMRLQLRGLTTIEIAETLSMTRASISYIINSDIYKSEFAKLQAAADEAVVKEQIDVRSKIRELSSKSIQELERMLNSNATSDKLKADICWDILDRDGHAPVERKESTSTVNVYVDAVTAAYEKRKQMRQLTDERAA